MPMWLGKDFPFYYCKLGKRRHGCQQKQWLDDLITLHYSDKCFRKKLRSLYIISNIEHYQTDEFSAGI